MLNPADGGHSATVANNQNAACRWMLAIVMKLWRAKNGHTRTTGSDHETEELTLSIHATQVVH